MSFSVYVQFLCRVQCVSMCVSVISTPRAVMVKEDMKKHEAVCMSAGVKPHLLHIKHFTSMSSFSI